MTLLTYTVQYSSPGSRVDPDSDADAHLICLRNFYNMSPQDKATIERHARTLRELVKRPENRTCADCKHNGASTFLFFRSTLTYRCLDPRWASWNMCVLKYTYLFYTTSCVAQVVFFCVFAAPVFTVEWAPILAKSSQLILTRGHPSRWRYVLLFPHAVSSCESVR